MEKFWQNKIKAFLHDPPDKALLLFHGHETMHGKHEAKKDKILQELNLKYGERISTADHIASAMQRLDIPSDYRMDKGGCSNHICFKGAFKPVFKHTLSGNSENLEKIRDFITTYGYEKALDEYGFNPKIVKEFLDKNNWKKTYFSLWRLLPEKYPLGYILPADTRIPDHSIWDHLDVTAAISSCLGDMGLLALKIPAVQEFISHSRKLSDLWASSHIFSLLLFEGIKEVIGELGPDVVIYPQLRGNPLLDCCIKNELSIENIIFDKDKIKIANLPNTFLCFIPLSRAEEYGERCKEAIKRKWRKISEKVKEYLNKINIKPNEELWNFQIEGSLSVVVAYTGFFNLDSYEKVKNDLPSDVKEKQDKWLGFVEKLDRTNYGHFYFPSYALLGITLTQSSRLWDAWEEESITGRKCLMCGLRNAIVERREGDVYQYWEDNAWNDIEIRSEWRNILKEGERLCAVCLVKRIYKEVFKEEFRGFKAKPPEFESVVEVAGRDFIKNVESDEDFKFLKEAVDIELIYEHEWKSDEKKKTTIKQLELVKKKEEIENKLKNWWRAFGKPNKYYAILMMDGDRIGKMLFGETLPNFGDFFHPIFKTRITEWEKGEDLTNMKRILSPSIHIAISRAMKDFSIYKVPEIVERNYGGFLVYSGGDDVLALFPTDKVLNAAKELQEFFKKDFYEIELNGEKRKIMGLGKYASMSAGIVFAHYKYPLYDVIEKVREAEKRAKNEYGRNAFYMTFIKRSGELLSAGGKRDFVDDFTPIVEAIQNDKISHRFIYDFLEVIEILDGDMLKAETKRLLKRRKTEKATNEEISDICGKIFCLVEKYKENNLPIEDVGKILKILYDAYRGEEE